jgi:FkbM family methyltransferase
MNIQYQYIKSIFDRPKPFKSLISKVLSQPKPLKFLISRFLMASGLCKFLKIQQNGFFLRFYPSSLSATLWISPEENRLSDELFFRRYLKHGDRVIDLGANIGTLTVIASLIVGEQGKVYSIEAHPQTYKYLLGNIKVNNLSNIETSNYAIGETSKTVVFSDISSDDQNQVSTTGQGINVSMVRLDELPIENREINLLKVDVEGYEKFVFEGGSRVLNHTQCVYFESSEEHFNKFGYQTKDVIISLDRQGFKCFKLTDRSTISQLPNNYFSEKCENLIAVKNIQSFIDRTNYVF